MMQTDHPQDRQSADMWRRASDSHDDFLLNPQREWEAERTVCRLQLQPTDHVLDLGCSLGNVLVRYAHLCEKVTALDHTWRWLKLLQERPDRPRNARLVLGDGLTLPFPDGTFDTVMCSQVIEHLRTPQLRAQLVAEIARVLRPRGQLVLSAYNYNLAKRINRWMGSPIDRALKEGFHSGDIYYYNFGRNELVRLLRQQFQVQRCVGIRNRVPIMSRLLGGIEPKLNRGLECTPISWALGWILVAACEKK